ncbi:MAG: phage portal protein [Clostridia bacterium]|nr:phage portal protein [Clostridia bacterium]
MINFSIPAATVVGLPDPERAMLAELQQVFWRHQAANDIKNRYYEGKISLDSVNLGIALPEGLRKLEIGCAWGAKCVDVLAARSMFDGFVGADGDGVDELNELVRRNNLIDQYNKAVRDELKIGATFATLSADPALGCKIRFHSAETAAALWDGDKGRIRCGMAIIDTAPDNNDTSVWRPSVVYLYTAAAIWVLTRRGTAWVAAPQAHRMGRPLMEPLVWNATSDKPFGRSRIKEPVRRLIDGYVRTLANASIGLEFATSPQKYLLGVTDEQYEAVTSARFRQYVGSLIAATQNPETGQNPVFGQLMQGSIQPHVDMLRLLATQFSAATGLTVTDTGVVNDANPTSSDAILAQSQTLVAMAEQLNVGNGDALRSIAQMALAIIRNTAPEELTDKEKAVVAHFRNPAMPSISVTADAAAKIAAVRPSFADTDVYLEMMGFSQADIRRIKAEEQVFFAQVREYKKSETSE